MERSEIIQKIYEEILRSHKIASLKFNLTWQLANFFHPPAVQRRMVKDSLTLLWDPEKLRKKLPLMAKFMSCYCFTTDQRKAVFVGLREMNTGRSLSISHVDYMLSHCNSCELIKFMDKLKKSNDRKQRACRRAYIKGGGIGGYEDYGQ
jgi:hypothetical protein